MDHERTRKEAILRGVAFIAAFAFGFVFWCGVAFILIALISGCARDQAVAARNIEDLAGRLPDAGPMTDDQVALAGGITSEAAAIARTTEPDAPSTTAPIASHKAAAREASRHAGTVRTIPAQVVGDVSDGIGSLASFFAPVLGGGIFTGLVGWLLGKRAASPVIAAAVRFGQAAIDRLASENPKAADEVKDSEKTHQERAGVREAVRAARRKMAKGGK